MGFLKATLRRFYNTHPKMYINIKKLIALPGDKKTKKPGALCALGKQPHCCKYITHTKM